VISWFQDVLSNSTCTATLRLDGIVSEEEDPFPEWPVSVEGLDDMGGDGHDHHGGRAVRVELC
jgi:hypothetical protein